MSQPSMSIWQQHRELFRWLYLEKDHPLKKDKDVVESVHGFPVMPLSTYETKLRDELKLRNLKPEEWAIIGRHLESHGPQSDVYLCGVRILPARVKRYVKRYKNQEIQGTQRIPPDVSIKNHSEILQTSVTLHENALAVRGVWLRAT